MEQEERRGGERENIKKAGRGKEDRMGLWCLWWQGRPRGPGHGLSVTCVVGRTFFFWRGPSR